MTSLFVQQKNSTDYLNTVQSPNPYIGKCVSIFQTPYFAQAPDRVLKYVAFNVGTTTYDKVETTIDATGNYSDTTESTDEANSGLIADMQSYGGFTVILVSDTADYDTLRTLWGLI